MGMINVATTGSFPTRSKTLSAMEHGHANAVAEAIKWLAEEVMPDAIALDHSLQSDGAYPSKGFDKNAGN